MVNITTTGNLTKGRPPAPTLTRTTGVEDDTPTLRAGVPVGAALNDYFQIRTGTAALVGDPADSFDGLVSQQNLTDTYIDRTVATALAEGGWYSWARFGRLHPNGKIMWSNWQVYGPYAIDLSGIAGAPTFSPQTYNVGTLSPSGVAFRKIPTAAPATGEPTANTCIDTATGLPSAHFEVTADGWMKTKVANIPAATYTLEVTLNNSAGAATNTVTVTAVAGRADCETSDQIVAAVAAMKTSSPTTDWKVYLPPGASVGTLNERMTFNSAHDFSGTLNAPNRGLANYSLYNVNAVSSWSGGSVKITCEIEKGATLRSPITISGARGVWLDGIQVNNWLAAPAGQASRGVNLISMSVANGVRPSLLIQNCKIGSFGAPVETLTQADIDAKRHFYIKGVQALSGDALVIEDTDFSGGEVHCSVAGVDYAELSRGTFYDQITDGLQAFSVNNMSVDEGERILHDWVCWKSTPGAGGHLDFLQFNTLDDRKHLKCLIRNCVGYGKFQVFFASGAARQWVEGNSYPQGLNTSKGSRVICTDAFGVHKFYLYKGTNNATDNALRGTAAYKPGVGASWTDLWTYVADVSRPNIEVNVDYVDCMAVSWSVHGITLPFGDCSITRCFATLLPGAAANVKECRFTAYKPGCTLDDSLCNDVLNPENFTVTNSVTNMSPTAQSGANSLPEMFDGTFTYNPTSGRMEWTLDSENIEDRATLLAAIKAQFTPTAGGSAVGRVPAWLEAA